MTLIPPSSMDRLTALQAMWTIGIDDPADAIIYAELVQGMIALLQEEEACREGRQQSAVRKMLSTTQQLLLMADWLPSHVPHKLAKHYQRYLVKLQERLVALDELDQLITYLLHYGHTQDRRMNVAGTLAQLDAQRLLSRNRLFNYFDGDKYHTFIGNLIDWLEEHSASPTEHHALPLRVQLTAWFVPTGVRLMRYDAMHQAGLAIPYNELWETLLRYRYVIQLAKTIMAHERHQHLKIVDGLLASCALVCQIISMRSKLIHLPISMLEDTQIHTLKQIRQQVRIEQDRRETEFIQTWQAVNLRQLYHDLLLQMVDLLA